MKSPVVSFLLRGEPNINMSPRYRLSSAAILYHAAPIAWYVHASAKRNIPRCGNCAWARFRSAGCNSISRVSRIFPCTLERIIVASYQHLDDMAFFAVAMALWVFGAQSKWIVEVSNSVVRIFIAVCSSREATRVFATEASGGRIVVSGAVVIQGLSESNSLRRVLEPIRHWPSRGRKMGHWVIYVKDSIGAGR